MKSLLLILPLLFVSISSFAGIEVRNGGGGWTSDGQYMTFYSAKIPAQKKPLNSSEIPGLNYLVKKIFTLKITESLRTDILKSIFPVSNRNYYKTNASEFDEDLQKDLKKKYAAIMGMSQENIAIFATTNPASNETILLPDFYQLSESEQAAILFHESLWILSPRLNYAHIISAEQAAQAYFENDRIAENIQTFYYILSLLMDDPTIPLIASLHFDKEHNLFPSKVDGTVPLESLFGREFIQCLATSNNRAYELPTISGGQRICSQQLFAAVVKSSMKYPSSIFFKSLLDYLKSEGSITFNPEITFRLSDISGNSSFLKIIPNSNESFQLSFPVVDAFQNVQGTLTFNGK